MLRLGTWIALTLLATLTACTEADRESMFSARKPPVVGRCDPQPGYPPPEQRPGCEYNQAVSRGK